MRSDCAAGPRTPAQGLPGHGWLKQELEQPYPRIVIMLDLGTWREVTAAFQTATFNAQLPLANHVIGNAGRGSLRRGVAGDRCNPALHKD